MTGFSTGPRLLVHLLIITMANALVFPIFYRWSGSILYAFLISVGALCAYGLIVRQFFGQRKH